MGLNILTIRDVARFTALLEEYRKAPDVMRRRLYLETKMSQMC
jgi:hypothetical protein